MIHLKRASENDANEINQMAVIIWKEHYPSIIGIEQVEYMLGHMYDVSTLKNQIHNEIQHYYIIQLNNISIGFISFEPQKDKLGFINKFYLNAKFKGKGFGTAAFEILINTYKELSEIRLQVNRQNIQAINFYFKLGFIIESCADFDIGKGYFMNDFIMLWRRPLID